MVPLTGSPDVVTVTPLILPWAAVTVMPRAGLTLELPLAGVMDSIAWPAGAVLPAPDPACGPEDMPPPPPPEHAAAARPRMQPIAARATQRGRPRQVCPAGRRPVAGEGPRPFTSGPPAGKDGSCVTRLGSLLGSRRGGRIAIAGVGATGVVPRRTLRRARRDAGPVAPGAAAQAYSGRANGANS